MREREGARVLQPDRCEFISLSLACDPGTRLPSVHELPVPGKPNGVICGFLLGMRVEWDSLLKRLTGGQAHGSHSPNVSSFAFAENSSWIVCKPSRCTGQNCSQELLNNTVYLYSRKIEIVML